MNYKLITLFLLAGSFFFACKKDEHKIFYEGGTPPVLTASASAAIPLSFATANDEALTLWWTNPDFLFTTGVSSQDVTYTVEIDTAGANFTNPDKAQVVIPKELQKTFTQNALNDLLLNQLQLQPSVPHTIEMRLISSIGNTAVALTSNVLQFTVTPYAIPPKVLLPPGQLFLVGSATDGGWSNPVPVPEQQFTQLSETLYEITIYLTGGQEYLFLPVNGSWDHKYAVQDNSVPGLSSGGDFGYNVGNQYNQNFPGPATSGMYKITADFQRGKFTVIPQ